MASLRVTLAALTGLLSLANAMRSRDTPDNNTALKADPNATVAALKADPNATVAVFQGKNKTDHGKVEVMLFYETMCPYCHHFIAESLKPFWTEPNMKELVDLKLLPAGNVQVIPTSMVSKGYIFWHPEAASRAHIYRCQHGESECIGNLIHACAQQQLAQEMYLELVFCMSERTSSVPEKSSYECMQQLSIDANGIRDCVFNPKTEEAMFAITQSDDQLTEQRKYVPWITVNGEHLEVNNGTAELKSAVCKSFLNPPAACGQTRLLRMAPSLASRRSEVQVQTVSEPSAIKIAASFVDTPYEA